VCIQSIDHTKYDQIKYGILALGLGSGLGVAVWCDHRPVW